MNDNLITGNLFNEVSNIISNARISTSRAINSNMLAMYWEIGKIVKTEIMNDNRAIYGEQLVNELSTDLISTYGRGYSRRNIFNMIKIYETFPDFAIVQSLTAQLSVTHLLEIIKIKEPIKREFYLTICVNENWNVKILKDRINSMLYERTLISK